MKNKGRAKKEAITLLLKLIVISTVTYFLFSFVFGVEIVKENNMYPAVHEGDLLLYYRPNKEYKTNDVVVYEVDGVQHIGRIVAKGSSMVDFTESGTLLLDNEIATTESFYDTFKNNSAAFDYPFQVPENEFFILSDFRSDNSSDSRIFGSIPIDSIEGVIITSVRRRDF